MPTSSRPVMLTLREINRATLARQMLLARERVSALAAIERLVAVQAQWPRPPYVALWTRLREFGRPALTDLFLTRKVVRATFLRATIHVVSARDFLAYRPALQPALDASMHAILKSRLDSIDVAALAMDRAGRAEDRHRRDRAVCATLAAGEGRAGGRGRGARPFH